PVDQALGRSPAMVLSTDKPLDEEFDITDIGEVRGYYWIDLKPKSKDTDFDKVRIGLRDDDLEIMELYDGLGQITRLTFTNVELNPDIAQGRFQFVPPPGVDVIDSTK
ncbi:MAG: outer-membrane lipoprotein carrier protein LolA, partial [Gammaproteobacteria bacterium]